MLKEVGHHRLTWGNRTLLLEIPTEREDPRDSLATISDPGVGQLYPDWLHGQAPRSVSPAQFTSKQGLPGPIMATVGGSHSFPPQVWTEFRIF